MPSKPNPSQPYYKLIRGMRLMQSSSSKTIYAVSFPHRLSKSRAPRNTPREVKPGPMAEGSGDTEELA